MKNIFTLPVIRNIGLVALSAGALGSLGLVLNAGRNTPVILLILFIGWVLSPFVALFVANHLARRWSVLTQAAIYCLMVIVTVCSLVGYSDGFNTPGQRPAFIFLMVPLFSWLLIMTVIPVARRVSRNNNTISKT